MRQRVRASIVPTPALVAALQNPPAAYVRASSYPVRGRLVLVPTPELVAALQNALA